MTGRSLGHYQILEKLGAGGMGEVFKARDTRLNRLVAIKILATDKVADPDRKRRFIQEAQAASALNHPNIVTIHDINSQDGVDYMVMEYISGKTLDALIPKQGMRLGEALKVAIPVAGGLAAAHGANIIHRDVKPSNIIVGDDGRVKVLDFGLAKLTEEAATGENDPTRTVRAQTEEGTVLGTVSYMSPEQAEGKKLDKRSDIFSFGALLYEMVTGHRAFRGGSRVSTLSAILKEEPAWPPGLPKELDVVLRRALRKDPDRRFQHMDDLKVALTELKEESDSGRLSLPAPTAMKPPARSWIWAALPLAIVAGFLLWRFYPAPKPAAAAEYKLRRLTADSGLTTAPALSTDGRLLAYASDRATQANLDIWVQPQTEGARPIRLTTDPADDSDPAFSPDGGTIAFWSQRGGGGIYLMPALGGDERLLVKGGRAPRFSPDGKWIAYAIGAGVLVDSKVFIVPAAGGVARQVGADIGWASGPQWSSDGQHLLVSGSEGANSVSTREFWLAPVNGGKSVRTGVLKRLTDQGLSVLEGELVALQYSWQDKALIVLSGSEAWAIDIGPAAEGAGIPRKLATATGLLRSLNGAESRFVFANVNEQVHLWSLPMDHQTAQGRGSVRALPHSGGDQRAPSISRDGRLVYMQALPNGSEIRIRDGLDGPERIVAAGILRPRISPDGTRIAYTASSNVGMATPGGLYTIDPAGGQATAVLEDKERVVLFNWTPDGKRLLYFHGTPMRFSIIDPETRQKQDLISHPTLNIHLAELSPDGKWVAFVLPDRGRALVIAPVRDGKAAGEQEWITVIGGAARQSRTWWSPDGNLLYFLSDRDRYGCIWAQRLEPATKRPVGEPTPVFHVHDARRSLSIGGSARFGPAVAKDQLVFGMLEQTANIWMAERVNR